MLIQLLRNVDIEPSMLNAISSFLLRDANWYIPCSGAADILQQSPATTENLNPNFFSVHRNILFINVFMWYFIGALSPFSPIVISSLIKSYRAFFIHVFSRNNKP